MLHKYNRSHKLDVVHYLQVEESATYFGVSDKGIFESKI